MSHKIKNTVVGQTPAFVNDKHITIFFWDGLSFEQRVIVWDKEIIKIIKELLGIDKND